MHPLIDSSMLYFTKQDALLNIISIAVVFILGYFYGKQLAQKGLDLESAFQKGARPWIVLFGFTAICTLMGLVYKMPTLFNPLTLGWLEPVAWLLATAGPVFLAGVALPLGKKGNRQKEAYAMIALAGISVVGVQIVKTPFVRPIAHEIKTRRMAKDGSILQSHNSTCTAAAFANALKMYNREATEVEVAGIFGTRRTGTTQYQVLKGIEHYGLHSAHVPVKAEYIRYFKRPTLVSVLLPGNILHSILVYNSDNKGNLMVIDPMSGKGKYTPKHYAKQLSETYGIVVLQKPIPKITATADTQNIKEVEQGLVQQGFLQQSNGKWQSEDQAALKAFQKKHALKATGKVDQLSWLLLVAPKNI